MNIVSLCSGIGGLEFYAQAFGFRLIAHVEKDADAQKVLQARYPDIPIYQYLENFNREYREPVTVDVISAGVPCQPHSRAAGQRRQGRNDTRNLWPATTDILDQFRPRWFVLENVRGIGDTILQEIESDLKTLNYQVRSYAIQAGDFGAEHRRERIFILAHNPSIRVERMRRERLKIAQPLDFPPIPIRNSHGQWQVEPDLCRSPTGFPRKLDAARLKQLGNAVYPRQAIPVWDSIARYEISLKETSC